MSVTSQEPALSGAIHIIDSVRVQQNATLDDVRAQISARRFFWLDICAVEASLAAAFLKEIGLNEKQTGRALQFGQSLRISIGRQGIRAVTWMASPTEELIELHFLSSAVCICTIWSGAPSILDDARKQFADRLGVGEACPFHAAAIVLQLLLGTLDRAFGRLDETIDTTSHQVTDRPDLFNFAELRRRRDSLMHVCIRFEGYGASVRSATVGLEAISGIRENGIAELDDYADRVEDATRRLSERLKLASAVADEHRNALAQRQAEQIDRLAVVSIIFLPISFLTGFFGMNFSWMVDRLTSLVVFLALGALLPVVCVILTIMWLRRRGII